jgi:hypothetical protein
METLHNTTQHNTTQHNTTGSDKPKYYKVARYIKPSVATMYCMLLVVSSALAQLSPEVNWRNYSYINHEYKSTVPVTQRFSDYDWWYDHCTAYTTPATKTGHLGYIACGTSKYRCAERSNTSALPLKYDETTAPDPGCIVATAPLFTGSYDYGNFENATSGKLGLPFNQIGLTKPDGTTGFLETMNYGGEYLRTKQLADGTFMTVGGSVATRKRTELPQNGTPLNYNPTAANSTNYFKYPEVFTGALPNQVNKAHIDVMRFNAAGTCLYNHIYGMVDFTQSATIANTLHATKQLSYYATSSANDFVQEPNATGYIAVVGSASRVITAATFLVGNACIFKINPTNGHIIAKRFIDSNPVELFSTIKAVEFATIAGVDYYLVAVTEGVGNYGFTYESVAKIYAVKTDLSTVTLLHTYTSLGNQATIWGMSVKNNKLYIPLITNCNWNWYSRTEGINTADLTLSVLDLTLFNNATANEISNTSLSNIGAFDLKARITPLANGDFGVVSSKKTQDWVAAYPSTTIPSYILYPGGNATLAEKTGYWNTDTYVACIKPDGTKRWDKTFDSDTPVNSNDFPSSPTSGGGDPKRQECMYGISQAPDGGIVVSGNSSANFDDNYMAKLYSDCDATQSYTVANDLNITNTVTWNFPQIVSGIIKIQAGGVLNITGTTTIIQFADSKQTGVPTRIEVYPGGTLNVTDATLTSITACSSSMWEGIVMIGAGNNIAQTTALQPRVALISATITNARTAVLNGNVVASVNKGGGWLTATGTTFLNNYNDVIINPYINSTYNKSAFLSCTFKADNYLNDPSYVDVATGVRLISQFHVYCNGVDGVTFTANTFKTDLTFNANYPVNLRGYGLQTRNSIFTVKSACTSLDALGNCLTYGVPNVFENLFYGTHAQSTNPLKTFSVLNANYTNCYSSLYQSGINLSKVEKNKFLINTTIPLAGAPALYFYYANNSSGYSHQENDYKVIGSTVVAATVLNSNTTASNESYRNVYTNCNTGHQLQLTNGTANVYGGLQIKCNQNTANSYDIAQASGTLGIQGLCGTPLTPANNTFSKNAIIAQSDINAYTGGGFKYNYLLNPNAGVQDPTDNTSNITKLGCTGGIFNYATSCPSRLIITSTGGGGGKAVSPIVQLQNNALYNKTMADSLTTVLNTQLVNGSKLWGSVMSTLNINKLNTDLLAQSPYLNDLTLSAYINKQPPLPAGHIKDVLIANSPLSTLVLMDVANANLPQGIYKQIMAAQAGANAKTDAINTIAYYNHTKDLAVNALMRYYVRDTTQNAGKEMVKWLEWNNSLQSKTDLVFAYTAQGNYARAQAIIDSLNLANYNTPYLAYLQHHKSLVATGKTWDELNTNTKLMASIQAIANDSLNPYMGHARCAMQATNSKYKNYEVIEDYKNNTTHRLAHYATTPAEETALQEQQYASTTVKVFPNPFNEELKINVSAPAGTKNNFRVELLDVITGRVVLQQALTTNSVTLINTSVLANGLYIVHVKDAATFSYYAKHIKLH